MVVENLHLHGGVERRTSLLVKELISIGHEVHIYARKCDPEAVGSAVSHHLPILRFDRSIKALSFAASASLFVRHSKHQLIHTQARVFSYDLATLGMGCHRGYMVAMGIELANSPDRRYDEAVLRIERSMFFPGNYGRIIVNSNMVKSQIVSHYGVPEEAIDTVYNGVDSQAFSPQNRSQFRDRLRDQLSIQPDEVVAVYAGAGFRRKGLDTIISAMGKLRCGNRVRLMVVGRGREDEYRKMAADNGVADRILWAGQTTDIAQYYAASDIFVLPTRYDPFANSTMEALASGLPVITTSTNGVSEILNDGESGFVVKPDSPEELSERIDLLAGDGNLRDSMGTNGRSAVLPYTWELNARRTIENYEAVIKYGRRC